MLDIINEIFNNWSEVIGAGTIKTLFSFIIVIIYTMS